MRACVILTIRKIFEFLEKLGKIEAFIYLSLMYHLNILADTLKFLTTDFI